MTGRWLCRLGFHRPAIELLTFGGRWITVCERCGVAL